MPARDPEPVGEGASTEERLEELEQVFSALAHATRRQILLTLHFRGGEVRAGEIAERFACKWPTTSRHLKVLEEAGLVRVKKKGRERYFELSRDKLAVAGGWLGWFEK